MIPAGRRSIEEALARDPRDSSQLNNRDLEAPRQREHYTAKTHRILASRELWFICPLRSRDSARRSRILPPHLPAGPHHTSAWQEAPDWNSTVGRYAPSQV